MVKNNFRTVYELYEDYIKKQDGNDAVMHYYDRTITADEFKKGVEDYTYHLIKLGVKSGDKAGYTMPNRPEIFYLFIAMARLGVCAVPLFHMIPDIGKVDIYKKANVKCVITTSAQFASLKDASKKAGAEYEIATIDENGVAEYNFNMPVDYGFKVSDFLLKGGGSGSNLPIIIASSSGTTGIPKLVAMTQSNIASEIYAGMELGKPIVESCEQNNKLTAAFPLSTAGIITLMGFLFRGMCLIYSAEISPVKFVELINMWKPSNISSPPAFLEAILSLPILDKFDLSSVQTVSGGMDFVSPSLLTRLKSKFVNLKSFSNGYGLIETCNVFMSCKVAIEGNSNIATNKMKLIENLGNEIEIRDAEGNSVALGCEGELYVRGSNVVNGYIVNENQVSSSFENGWFRTGDIARNEGENIITLLGRKKYLIKRGGKSVSPIVVQNHINKLNGVKNAAVVGVPHQLYGEMVWAFVVKDQGADIKLKDVMRHCRLELANYMVPDQVTFIDEIPKNSGVGKVNFEKLKQMAQLELESIEGGNL